jgi:hypothetical protein
MSIPNRKKIVFAALAALCAALLAGCGSKNSAEPPAATSATGATQSVAPSGDTGSTAASEPTSPAANPNDTGGGDEQAARTGVEIGLKNGGITTATARKVHVAPYIAIEFDITVADSQTYNLVITGGDGKDHVVTYTKPGSYKQTIAGLRPNKSASVVLGGAQAIKITADANPGP